MMMSLSRTCFLFGLLMMTMGCGRNRPDFGTLPRVEVPLEKKPAQDPTLFRDDDEKDVPQVTSDPPDPPPLRTSDQIEYHLEFNKGEVSVLSARLVKMSTPQSTARRIGRFAFELWTGPELIERVRFDFPLLAAGSAGEEDVIESGLVAETKIRVPAAARATSARILDRKTRSTLMVTWPPESKSPSVEPSRSPQDPASE